MSNNHKNPSSMLKVLAFGSMFSLAASMVACSPANSDKTLTGKVKEQSKEKTKNVIKNPTQDENGEKKPNVIYIILDDIGFSDIGSYGSEIKTPNIDQLAANGLRYNNFNATPLCSPTRASLLTGREHNSVGMGHVANFSLESDHPNLQGSVTPTAGTVAEMLKEEGYSTYGVGKWHIAPSHTVTPAGPYDYWPLSKGFEKYYGFMDGEIDQYHPQLVNGNELIPLPRTDRYNLNDDLSAQAKQYITDHVSIYPEKPFFMNFAFGTAHSPLQVPKEYIDMYDGVYEKGWDIIREERFNRQKELGIIPGDATLAPSDPTVEPWDSLSEDKKKLYVRFMQTYAGFITQADEIVGELVSYLKETSQYDNTMIVLIGDNGATDAGGPDGTDSFLSTNFARVATTDELLTKYDLIGGPDMQALYPKGWGQVSNTPFKGYKQSVYAGALRNPLIISWAEGIRDKGGIRTQYVHVTDITPTVLDVLDFKAPELLKGIKQMPMYGTSIVNTFDKADAPEMRDTAITYLSPSRAIYHEGWKAIAKHEPGTSFDEDVWELYKVSEDYTESENIADEHPEKLKELQELFMSEAEKYNMLPLIEFTPQMQNYIKADSAANRTNFKYYPETGIISPFAAPQVGTNSFIITVPVTRENEEDSGVLVAMGDEMGGYSLYIKDNKLVFLFNTFGEISKITSDVNVTTGKSELKLVFDRTSIQGGKGILYINGENVGEGEIQTAPHVTFEGLSIGKDSLKAVTEEYKDKGEFAFSGQFDYVQFDITEFVPEPSKNND